MSCSSVFDSPFWSKFPSTDRSIKQRKQNLALARALLQAAGQERPKFTITTWNGIDLPDYAQAIQAAGRQAGMDIDLEVQSNAEFRADQEAQINQLLVVISVLLAFAIVISFFGIAPGSAGPLRAAP